MLAAEGLESISREVDAVFLRGDLLVCGFVANARCFVPGESETVAMDAVVFKKELLVKFLIQIFAGATMLDVHVVFELV
jgi:hypothetical protein